VYVCMCVCLCVCVCMMAFACVCEREATSAQNKQNTVKIILEEVLHTVAVRLCARSFRVISEREVKNMCVHTGD